MLEDNRLIAKNTLFLYIRTIVVMLISFYTSRVVLQALGVVDYGIYNVVGGLVSLFSFINGSMAAATIRYLTFELGKKDYNRLNEVFCTCIQIHFLISLIVVLLAESIGMWLMLYKMIIPLDRLNIAIIVFQISIITSVISIMNVPFNSLLIAHERMSSFAYISILDAILKFAVAISVPLFLYDKMLVYAILMCFVFVFIISIYRHYCHVHFPESYYHIVKDKVLAVEMTKYAFWSLLSNIAFVTYTHGVNLLLNVFFGPTVNAARALSVQVQAGLGRFVQSFQSALNPQITKSYARDERDRLFFLVNASSRFSFYLVLLLIFPVMVEIDYILSLWLETVPDYTSCFIRLTLLWMPISVMLNPLNIATQATGRIKRFALITGGAQLLILPSSYLVLKLGGGPETVYYVYLSISYLNSFVYIYLTCSEIKLSMWLFLKSVFFQCLAVAIMSALITVICNLNNYCSHSFWSAITNMIIADVSVLFSIYLIGMNRRERGVASNYIRTKVARIFS